MMDVDKEERHAAWGCLFMRRKLAARGLVRQIRLTKVAIPVVNLVTSLYTR